MKPSGCNQWQLLAKRRRSKPQKQAKSVALGCHRLPANFHGKEGVDGSSPSEGSAKAQHTELFFSDTRGVARFHD